MDTVMSSAVLSNVSKCFGRTQALDDVDLTLATGVTGLLGPNGAGKTTLLRILATALAADRGEVRVLGDDPTTPTGPGRGAASPGLRAPGDRLPPRVHGVRVRRLHGDPQGVVRPRGPARRGTPGHRPGRT